MSIQSTLLNIILYYYIRPRMLNGLDLLKLRADGMPASKARPAYGCTFETRRLAGVEVTYVRPAHLTSDEVIVFFHGGMYLIEMIEGHWDFLARVCRDTGRVGIMVDYRLAPEHPFPAALDDAVAVLQALSGKHDASRLVVAGDSAGGGLAVAGVMKLRDTGQPVPGKLVLLSPWLDLTMDNPQISDFERKDRMLVRAGVVEAGRMYAGEQDPAMPYLSPVYGDLAGLPPVLMLAGTSEILLPDCRVFSEKAGTQGVEVVYREYPNMFHDWAILFKILPEGEEAVREVTAFITGEA